MKSYPLPHLRLRLLSIIPFSSMSKNAVVLALRITNPMGVIKLTDDVPLQQLKLLNFVRLIEFGLYLHYIGWKK